MNVYSYYHLLEAMTKKEVTLQTLFKILGDESRFRIVLYLAKGEKCVCSISKDLELEQTLVSHHLNTLRDADLIQDRKIGTWVYCSLNKKMFEKMEELYQKFLAFKNISDKSCGSREICK